MKKKGFTLIELLAVIVILGIIALISIPIINGVIKESRLGAFKASTLSLFHAYTNYEAEHGFEVKDELSIFDLDITNKNTFLSGEIYRKEDSIKVETVSNGFYCASGTSDNLKIVEGTCDLLDETPPLIISVTSEVTTNFIKLYTSYLEEESFIRKHEYRISKEDEDIESASWISGDGLTENLSTKTFSNLEQGIRYKIQIKLTNTSLENSVSEIYELEVSTLTLEKPVINLLTSKEYATEKEVKITYPEGEGFTYEYSLDGENWISTNENEKTIVVEENTTVRARVYDGTNVVYADALTVSGIDKTKPVVTIVKSSGNNQTVLNSTVDPVSTASGYTYIWYKDGEVISGETSSTLMPIISGIYQLKVTTGSGVESVSNEITVQAYTITYNLNGGTGSITSGTKVENVAFNITSQVPTKAGYQFVGWGLTSTDKVPTYTSGSSYTKNENITLYAIWKKGYTITFVENGATLSKKIESCEVYNNETSCQITTPTITRSGYSIIGYGESAGAKTSVVGNNASLTVTGNKMYYAVTSKALTANFNKNTVSAISATSSSCTIYNTETSCTPTLPTITPQTNFTNHGWATSAGQTSNGATSITLNTSNTGSTWYALNSRVLTWNFNKNTVSAISKTSASCTIWNASGSCTITTPTITAQTNFTQQGFGTASGSTSAVVAQNASMTLNNTTTGGTYYALNARRLTWNFNKGSVSSISKTTDGCTIWNTSATCTISAPTITPISGYTQNGFGTASTAISATVAHSGTITLSNISNGGTYYGLQKKTVTITYNGNGATGGSTTSQNCTMYNANTSCAITLNSNGFTRTSYNFLGWGTGITSVSHNVGGSYSFSNNTTLYAIWKSAGIGGTIANDPSLINGGGGVRYAGANPNNYVSFNGELWRIIGVFDGKTKIIRNESIGQMVWNNLAKSYWPNSSLYSYLNTTYYNRINTMYKNMIENATWRIGGKNRSDITAAQIYEYEGDETATGYIGLMSASDFGYASSGCYNGEQVLYNYHYPICKDTSWLTSGLWYWTITLYTSKPATVFVIKGIFFHDYHVFPDASGVVPDVRPSLYLKSTVHITGGTGTSSDPYTLGM